VHLECPALETHAETKLQPGGLLGLAGHHDTVDENVTMKSKRLGLTTVLGDKLTSDGDGGDGDSLVEIPQVASSASVSSAPDPVLCAIQTCGPNAAIRS
jgi:hypothetical protein